MISLNVDLGQIIIATVITIIGWLVKREIDIFTMRLDKHDVILFKLVGDVQRLIGQSMNWDGANRRTND